MEQRVRLHRAARGPEWALVEEPVALSEAIRTKCGQAEIVLLDCLTMWLSNVLLEAGEAAAEVHQIHLLDTLTLRERSLILVSNEVGMGIVPEHPLGRVFRDYAGFLNQRVAGLADRVVFVVAGLPLYLKGSPGKRSRGV
jgi:adenosylcobinamide kinase/adenosylcobinamide-phosphate guanylyltransferase